jgi:hypothetical protein
MSGANTAGIKAKENMLIGLGCPIPNKSVTGKHLSEVVGKNYRFNKRHTRQKLEFETFTSVKSTTDRS